MYHSSRSGITIISTVVALILIVVGGGVGALYFMSPSNAGKPDLTYTMYTQSDLSSSGYKVYGNPNLGIWAGKLVITNSGIAPAYNVQVTWTIDNFATSDPHTYSEILQNSTVVDLFYPLLPASVTSLQSQTPSNIRFTVTYASSQASGAPTMQISDSKPITILGANDFIFSSLSQQDNTGTFNDIFSNYKFVATFATVTDPMVQKFADMGNALAGGPEASRSDAEAMSALQGIWDLATYNNVSYKAEPSAFWTGQEAQYVYYPRDVLQNHIGTCFDTAIFIATMALAVGIPTAYVYMIPGHAFPVIKLPVSGNLVPIESTLLNYKVPFSEALNYGMNQTWKEAMAGPYLPIDIATLQAEGYTPPQLPTLPTNSLTTWGYVMPSAQQQQTAGTNNTQTMAYTHQSPSFKFSYPSSWSTVPASSSSEIILAPSTQSEEFVVGWAQGTSAQQLRTSFESLMGQQGTIQLQSDKTSTVGGVQADQAVYSYSDTSGNQYIVVARFVDNNGFTFLISYQVPNDANAQANVNQCEQVVASFMFV